jgi:hypothetical protein
LAQDGFGRKDIRTWTDEERSKDRKALTHIHLHLSNNILQEVLEEKTAAALWLKLESIYMSKDLTSKMHVKMKLFSHKLQEGGSVLTHISVFKAIVADLTSMEVKFDDEDLALLLLCSLPTSFSNFRDTILYSRDTLTVAEVYEALTVKEKMRQMVNSEDAAGSSGEALYVHGRSDQKKSYSGGKGKGKNQRGRSKSRGPSDELFCKYCKKMNNVIKNCYKLQKRRTGTRTRVRSVVLSLLPPKIILIMVMFLLPLLDVLMMMLNGSSILLACIMFALTNLYLLPIKLCRTEALFGWEIILLALLLAWAPCRSR